MVKALIKFLWRTAAPQSYAAAATVRANRHGQRIMEEAGTPAIADLLSERYGIVVLTGPFKGMQYIDRSIGASFLPKLIGSYECELHGVLARLLATEYDTVVDVGSAEGYYAVGLALHLPNCPVVHAFDIDPQAQRDCHELAAKNATEDRVIIGGFCDASLLQATLRGKSLVVCDCEGYELDLLDPAKIPALATADLLVELHDILHPGITPVLLERFSGSHGIQMIDSTERNPEAYPQLHFLSPPQQEIALSEFRNGPQQWAFMTPNEDARRLSAPSIAKHDIV